MKESLKEGLKPLYAELLPLITTTTSVVPFCMEWGEDFPTEKNTGVLFIGKATNGWGSDSRDVEQIFGEGEYRLFARKDKIEWIHNQLKAEYKRSSGDPNARNSAFMRVMVSVSKALYKNNTWYTKVAWSNLYKVAPPKGNPKEKLKKEQYSLCKKILQKEIEILSPRFVVFLTSGWENEFVNQLLIGIKVEWELSKWGKGSKYQTRAREINGRVFICSPHPQGKSEKEHVTAIVDFIKRYSIRAVPNQIVSKECV